MASALIQQLPKLIIPGTYSFPTNSPSSLSSPIRSVLGTSPVTDADRTRVLGTRCGTPRLAPKVVCFADVSIASCNGVTERFVEKRTRVLGASCGSPRRSSCVSFVVGRTLSSTTARHEDIPGTRSEILGTRRGTPRKQRASCAISFTKVSTRDSGGTLERTQTLGSRCGTPRKCRIAAFSEDAGLTRASSCKMADLRSVALGSRQGTPTRSKELLRVKSAEKSAIRRTVPYLY